MEDKVKQKQIEEMAQIICGRSKDDICLLDKCSCDCECGWARTAEAVYNAGYRKIPENAVVLTREDMKKYAEDCIAGQETGLDIINALISRGERYKEKAKQARKETAEKFAEMAKAKKKYITSKSYNTCEAVFIKDIDEICKEFTEGSDGKN